jgi:tetraacyldisaccharide 4'-kinase
VLRLAIQRRLERGDVPSSFVTTALSHAWEDFARVARPLVARRPVLCVGGATLGGSGRTPLAIACAHELERFGHRVALVGHAYRAKPQRDTHTRRVREDDDVDIVGDEALECARAGLTVYVGRKKQNAIDTAERNADVIVLDGVTQLAPKRATLALLASNTRAPWGSGACPPLGDLRATREAILAATDQVVAIDHDDATSLLLAWPALRTMRLGLATAVARHERILAFLESRMLEVARVVAASDHGALEIPRDARIDLWLTTPKDAPRIRTDEPVAVIDYHLNLPRTIRDLLRSRFPRRF